MRTSSIHITQLRRQLFVPILPTSIFCATGRLWCHTHLFADSLYLVLIGLPPIEIEFTQRRSPCFAPESTHRHDGSHMLKGHAETLRLHHGIPFIDDEKQGGSCRFPSLMY